MSKMSLVAKLRPILLPLLKMKASCLALALAFFVLSQCFVKSSIAAEGESQERYETLSKEVILNEIALAKYNLKFRLNSAKQGRWKGTRYFLFNEANATLGTAGLIVPVAERLGHSHGTGYQRLHRAALMHGNVLGGVGQIIGGAGSALEFSVNSYHYLQADLNGFSPGEGLAYVIKKVNEIDSALSACRAYVREEQNVSSVERTIRLAELDVLEDVKKLLAAEFVGFHRATYRTLSTQQSFYLLDIARNTTGALANLYGYKALRQQHRIFNQPAGLLNIISGAFIVVDPIVSRYLGLMAYKLDGLFLKRKGLTHKGDLEMKLAADFNILKEHCQSCAEPSSAAILAARRLGIYADHVERFDAKLKARQKEIDAGNKVAAENIGSGIFIGATKIGNGVPFSLAGFKYYESPRRTNNLLGAGATVGLVGSSYAMLQNLRLQAMREIRTHKLAKNQQLPAQLIEKQIEDLDDLAAQAAKL